jgi:hypothetical protein
VNCPPIANAGQDQSAHPGFTVSLDGSGSSDPDGHYPLSYFWELEKPSGSDAELSDPTSVNPSFTVDTFGDYTVRLVVTDSEGVQSEADEAVISTVNTAPVADAGADQTVTQPGITVYLDGSQSYDEEGDTLTYAWTIISKPETSFAELSNAETATPNFIADVYGDYTIQLIVRDPWDASAPDTVLISFENVPPIADAGGSKAVWIGETVYLDGTGSHDANGDPLSYAWEIVSRPAGSAAAIDTPLEAQASFIADAAGSYVISLVVNDGLVNSAPDNITVEAMSVQEEVAQHLKDAIDIINDFDPSVFKNKNMQKTLVNKINAVLQQIDQGLYQEALSKLENDIIDKVDGCASTGAPDKNDMVQDCEAQEQLYPFIESAIDMLLGRI